MTLHWRYLVSAWMLLPTGMASFGFQSRKPDQGWVSPQLLAASQETEPEASFKPNFSQRWRNDQPDDVLFME